MTILGTVERPLRAAIVGSGPSGFYAAEALLKAEAVCAVDMFERQPTPYGLVRSGVAPDNMKIRNVTKIFEKIAVHERFRYFGNVDVGVAVPVHVLRRHYDAVIFACGTETNLRLGIPGEELPGCHTATSFVGWYNGHPIYRNFQFDLSQEIAVVVGMGNVAVDVARILTRTPDELKHTDISQDALDALAESKVREVHIVGRRGPAQAKFKENEIRELGRLADGDCIVDPADLTLNPESCQEAAAPNTARILGILESFSRQIPTKNRRVYLRFLLSPLKITGAARAASIIFEKNTLTGDPFRQEARGSGEVIEQPCGLLFASIGYRAMPMPGVPFDTRRGIIPNDEGRVLADGAPTPGLYTAGWVKRGPSGLIGTNKPDSAATVQKILEDLPRLTPCEEPAPDAMPAWLAARGIRAVSFAEWLKIDAVEIERGKPRQKPREKLAKVSQMLEIAGGAAADAPSASVTPPNSGVSTPK